MLNRFRPAAPARAALVSSLTIAVSLSAARAQEVLEISDERTDETFSTSTSGDITLLASGVLNLEDVGLGPVITLNTDNQVLVEGDINVFDGDDAVAIALTGAGGVNAGFVNEGLIFLNAPEDEDTSDDETPPLFSNRSGVAIGQLGETFIGDVRFRPNGTIASTVNVAGDESYALVLRGDLDGDLTQSVSASTRILGDNSVGVALFGEVSGLVEYAGVIDADGVNTAGLVVDGGIDGALVISGSVTSTAYQTTARLNENVADEELAAENAAANAEQAARQGGSAIAIRSSISGGFLLNAPNADDLSDTDNVDERFEIDLVGGGEDLDNDGVGDEPDGVDDRAADDVPAEQRELTQAASVSVFGSAPAIHISQGAYSTGVNAAGDGELGVASGDILLEAVGEGDDAFGAIFRGTVTAAGIFDGRSSTAVAIEGAGGFQVEIENGALFANTVSSSAREAASTAVRIGDGAILPRIENSATGAIQTVVTAFEQNAHDATALLLTAGASVGEVENSGNIIATGQGSGVSAFAFRDLSGSVTSFVNTGRLEVNQVASFDDADGNGSISQDEFFDFIGVGVAADFSANTTGVTFVNEFRDDIAVGSANSAAAARVIGDVLFGSGDDTFLMGNGILTGARALPGVVDFGDGDDRFIFDPRTDGGEFEPIELGQVVASLDFGTGADTFTIRGGRFNGAITSTDGVSIEATGGQLRLINLSALDAIGRSGDLGEVRANDVLIGSEVDYRYQIDNSRDLADGQAVRVLASGVVTIEQGASVTPILVGDLPELATVEVFRSDIMLDFQGSDPNDLIIEGVTPFLYDITYSLEDLNGPADGVTDTLLATLRRREASEVGIFEGQFDAYDVLIESIQLDDEIRDAVGDITIQSEFVTFFNQIIPDHSDSVIAYQTAIAEGARRGVAGRASAVERDTQGAWSFWADEFTFFLSQDEEQEQQGYAGGGFGLAFGADKPLGPFDAVGLLFAYASPSYDLKTAGGTRMAFTSYELGPYVASKIGSVALDLSATYGLIDYDTTRTIALGDIRRSAEADGSGSFISVGARASYEKAYGNYYVRPEAQFSYVDLTQDAFSEGGFDIGDGVALQIGERDFTSARAILETTVGRRKPNRYGYMDLEARLGVRNEFITDAPEAVVTPQGFDESFTLTGAERSDIAVRGGIGASFVSGVFSQVDLTYDSEFADQEMRHEFRIIGRIRF